MSTQAAPETRYRAPALEKGLDILELLAGESTALTMSQLSDRLGRSKGEIFRMLQVLEERGYIARRPGEEGYALTNRLFTLGVERPPMRGLLEVGLPIMHRLAEEVRQSCHLAVASQDEIVVVARVESPGAMGFSVRLGHRAPIAGSTSGLVLTAYQSGGTPPGGTRARALGREAEAIRAAGYAAVASKVVKGVTDLSAPILQSSVAIAALTIPFVETTDALDIDHVTGRLLQAAEELSNAVRVGDAGSMLPT
jgi:DNA-binding IclR family transcriptional regulator